jgi:hypothetical protein
VSVPADFLPHIGCPYDSTSRQEVPCRQETASRHRPNEPLLAQQRLANFGRQRPRSYGIEEQKPSSRHDSNRPPRRCPSSRRARRPARGRWDDPPCEESKSEERAVSRNRSRRSSSRRPLPVKPDTPTKRACRAITHSSNVRARSKKRQPQSVRLAWSRFGRGWRAFAKTGYRITLVGVKAVRQPASVLSKVTPPIVVSLLFRFRISATGCVGRGELRNTCHTASNVNPAVIVRSATAEQVSMTGQGDKLSSQELASASELSLSGCRPTRDCRQHISENQLRRARSLVTHRSQQEVRCRSPRKTTGSTNSGLIWGCDRCRCKYANKVDRR